MQTTPTLTPATREYQHFVDGSWCPALSGATFAVYQPFTGAVYAEVPVCERADAESAIAAADAAQPGWAALAPRDKQRLFVRAAEIVERRRDEVSEALALETGCTVTFAQAQQDAVQAMIHHAAHWVYAPTGEVLASNYAGSRSLAVRRPLGVVASITPWNGGSVLAWRSVLGPLAAGNSVVVKPSEESPVTAGLLVAEVLEEAGLPPGVVNVVTHPPGAAGGIADAFFERPEVRCINFIGSVATGRRLAERAGRKLKRTVMELGGFNPMIVLDDTDVMYAARVAVFNSFFHQGQICLNTRRILVAEPLYERFVAELVAGARALPSGDPSDPRTVIGPLINDAAVRTVHGRIEAAIQAGGHLMSGGQYDGRVYQPTVLVDVPPDAAVQQHETFGPVVTVDPVRDADQAVAIVNASLYGLTSSVLSGDVNRATAVAERLRSGAVHINAGTVNDELQAPIGGVRDSGWGRSGPHSIDDFSDLVWLTMQSGERPAW